MTCGLLVVGVLFVAPSTANWAAIFDLPPDQEHKVELGRQCGPVSVSKVVPGDYVVYLSFANQGIAANVKFVEPKTTGKLIAQRRTGKTVYYAIKTEKQVRLPGAGPDGQERATVTIVHRYQVDLPPGDKPFLNLADNQWQKVAAGALKDLVKISKVIPADYAHYQKLVKGDRITAHERRGKYIYYAAEEGLDVPFANGSTAWLFVTHRYIARVPDRKD